MKFPRAARSSSLENKTFLLLLVLVSLAFFWVLWPFYGAAFWGAVLAIIFAPVFARLRRAMPKRSNLAALATVAIIVVMVILPVGLVAIALVEEASGVYQRMQTGELSLSRYFQQMYAALPAWLVGLLDRFGMSNFSLIQERLTGSIARGSQFLATQALNIGQNAFDLFVSFFVMLYLLFFLLRDGNRLARKIENAVPLEPAVKRELLIRFVTVIRATVKGNVVVAALQGALGGLIFWLLGIEGAVLWGTVMAFLSLLPAVGAAMVWLPVAVYFLVTGSIANGLILTVFGVLVIGLIDNLLRPVLVGKDTRMPDYVVLISTLGGMALFGLNGFVIGPVIAAMFMAVWSLFAAARVDEAPESPAVVAQRPEPWE